jgi:hypothetical protein
MNVLGLISQLIIIETLRLTIVPTHTQLVSRNGKEIEEHTQHSPNGGRYLGK